MVGYQDLKVWKLSMRFALNIYKETKQLPSDERFGLTSQLRRAAVSVPSNIAEGHGRGTPGDLARFVRIALGSLAEVETQLYIAQELDYIDRTVVSGLLSQVEEIGRMLSGLIRSTKRS